MRPLSGRIDRSFIFFVFNIISLCLLAGRVGAETQHGRYYGLAELELLALEYNAGLKSDQFMLEGTRYAQEQIKGDSGWQFRANYNYYERGQRLYHDEPEDLTQWGEMVWAYPLWERWYKSRYAGQEKQIQADEQQIQLEWNRLEVLHRVRQAFWLAQQYAQLKERARYGIEKLNELVKQIKLRQHLGFSLEAEVLEAEGGWVTRRQELAWLEQAYTHQLQNLSRLVGDEVRLRDIAPAPIKLPPQEEVRGDLKNHPALRLLEVRAKREEVLAQASQYQNLNIWAESGISFQEYQDNNSDTDVRLGIRLSIPLGYRELERLEKQVHLTRRDSWRAQWQERLRDMEAELAQIYFESDNLAQEEESAKHRLAEAKEKIHVLRAQQDYSIAGGIDNPWPKLMQAYQAYWGARKRFTELKYQRRICYARLQRLWGGETEKPPSAPGCI